MNGLVLNQKVSHYIPGTIDIDPNKTLLNDFLQARENKEIGGLLHLPPEKPVSMLSCGDGSMLLCWEANGSIYVEDKPTTLD